MHDGFAGGIGVRKIFRLDAGELQKVIVRSKGECVASQKFAYTSGQATSRRALILNVFFMSMATPEAGPPKRRLPTVAGGGLEPPT